jgi:hypothetical protein
MNILSFSDSPMVFSLTPPCFPYTISKGKGGKYPKKDSKGGLLVEVWTSLLKEC